MPSINIHMPNKNVKICNDKVIKTGEPELMRVEVEKTVRAFEIGRECGLFRVPNVLDYDDSKGVIVFERLHDIREVKDIVAFGHNRDLVVENIGASLAHIHKELVLPKEMIIPLPPEFSLPGNEVFLHGDLSVNNVFVGPDFPPVIILDWQMTAVHGGRATYGSRYFDLMWFVNNLFYRPSHKYLFSNKPIEPIARRFLASYFEKAETAYNAEEFVLYMNSFFKIKLALRRESFSWTKRLLLAHSHSLLRKFIFSFNKTINNSDIL